ncbi:MAG: hypothetical protein ABJD97_02850 [Betaproteobacteria bacterium]
MDQEHVRGGRQVTGTILGRTGLAALAVIAMSGCSAQPAGSAPPLAPAAQARAGSASQAIALDRKFDEPLPVHLRGDPDDRTVKVATCAEYAKVRARVNGSDSEMDYAVVKSEGAHCDALLLLRKATAASHAALPAGDFLSWRTANQFPGSLWASFSDEEKARLAAPGATLQTASGKASFKSVPAQFLELESRSAGIHLSLIGLGDVDHDGWQDAVVLVEGYAKGGSATTTRAAVLTRRTGETLLRELPVDVLLK